MAFRLSGGRVRQPRSLGGASDDAGGPGGGDVATGTAGGAAGAAAGIVTTSCPVAGVAAGCHIDS